MKITLTDTLTSRTANDGQAIAFTAKTYDDSDPAVLTAPTTLQYRIDDLTTGEEIADWTSGSASSSQTLTVTAAQNTPTGDRPRYRRQLTVRINAGLSTCQVATREYFVRNLGGVS